MESKNIKIGTYALLSNVSITLFSFIGFLIIIRSFSKEQFGVWALFLAVTSFVEMTRMGFIYHGIVKYSTENEDQRPVIFTTGLVLNALISAILALFLFLLSDILVNHWNTPEIVALINYYGLFLMINGITKYLEYHLISNQDFKAIFYSNVFYGICYAGLLLVMFILNKLIYLEQIVMIQSGAAALTLIFLTYIRRKFFKVGNFSFHWIKKLFHYGKYVFGTNLSSMLLQKTDILMIGFFINPAAMALYNIATRFTNYIEMPMKAISQIVFPKIVSTFNREGKAKVGTIFEKSVGLLLILVIPPSLLLLIFAKPVLVFVAGEQYGSSALILQILLIYSFIKPWGRVIGLSLDAIGKPNVNFLMLLVGLSINIILNYFLIQSMGVIGAATATVITILISTSLSLFLLSKILTFSLIQPFYFSWNYVKEGLRILKFKLSYN